MQTTDSILCFYKNSTRKLQLVRMQAPEFSHASFERLVFPGEQFMFEASPNGILEIYTDTPTGMTLLENVGCQNLQVRQKERTHVEKQKG